MNLPAPTGAPPCMALKKSVFSSPEFKTISDKDLVLVELDYPRKKKLAPEQEQYNAEMQKKYGITGYPTVYILNPKGEAVWFRIGGGDKNQYLEDVRKGIKNAGPLMAALEKIKKTEGKEKLETLDKAWQMMSRDLKKKNTELLKEIIALDKDDTLGYAKEEQKRIQIEKQREELFNSYRPLLAMAREGKKEEAVKELTKLAAREDLLPSVRQSVYMSAIYGIQMDNGDFPAAIQALKDAIQIDPSTEEAKNCEYLIKHLETNKDLVMKRMQEKKQELEKIQKAAAEKKE